jgi:hypothetical protein
MICPFHSTLSPSLLVHTWNINFLTNFGGSDSVGGSEFVVESNDVFSNYLSIS